MLALHGENLHSCKVFTCGCFHIVGDTQLWDERLRVVTIKWVEVLAVTPAIR